MISLGAKLRETRERKGLSLEEISMRTKIRQSYLEAIENDRLESIPGGFFSRSFARQYAEALGVENDLDALLRAATPAPGLDVKLEKLTDYRSPNKSLILPGGNEEEGTEFYHEAAFLKERQSNTGWMIAAAMLACLSLGYLAWSQKPELLTSLIPSRTVAVAETPAAAAAPAVASAVEAKAEQTPAPVPEAAPKAPVVVEVKALEPTWLRLTADGRQTFDGTMSVGETRTFRVDETAILLTGNAGGLDVVYNGKPVGPVGPSGRVRTVVFTPESYEILASSRPPRKPGSPSGEDAARAQ